MSARWLLDVAALSQAARHIVRNHGALRSQQAAIYNRTSSLAAAFRESLVLPTIRDATRSSLGKSNTVGQVVIKDSDDQVQGTVLTSDNSNAGPKRAIKEQGIGQDHHYNPSPDNTAVDPKPATSLPVEQSRSSVKPLPDGTLTAPEGEEEYVTEGTSTADHSLSSGEARSEQRSSEDPIPAEVAQEPPGVINEETAKTTSNLGVFNDPTTHKEPALSSLPRSKIPANAEDSDGADRSIAEDGLNQDVYHSPHTRNQKFSQLADSTLTGDKAQNTTGIKDDASLDQLFHSPRIAKGLLNRSDAARPLQRQHGKPHNQPWPPKDRFVEIEQEDISQIPSRNTASQSESPQEILSSSLPSKDVSDAGNSQVLSTPYELRESRVPASRFGRMWQYAGLGASMTLGAAAESFRRVTGSASDSNGSLVLSAANMERLVSKLSRMRGAALKIGQLLSFQDSKVLPPAIVQVLQRVQDSADFMPASQRNQVLTKNLGSNWRELFTSFEERPIAAASIGQVHAATLKSNGQDVVVKVQYPGVADSIDSDLNNLSILLHASRLLPKGLYLNKTIDNARTELSWECDYVREADAARTFQKLLADEQQIFSVPTIYDEASGPQVLTMQRMNGTAATKLQNLSQEQKDWIGTHILRLCLKEITEFRYMQTDPNWTNFLFNSATQKIELLDFGASRDYPEAFIEPYTRLLHAASRNDREACRELSIKLGYLTGMESRTMLDAHIQSLTILAEPFKSDAPQIYDFSDQTVTDRVRALIPVMLKERLSPPPEETYSLHRKLSGAFLLLARLGSRVNTKDMFENAMIKAGVI